MNKQHVFRFFLTLICVIGLNACATSGSQQETTAMIPSSVNAPDWVNKGCGDVDVLCGVGSASTLGDYSLGRRESEGFAKMKLRSTIETYVGYLMKTFKERITSGDKIIKMETTKDALKVVVGGTVNGARIVDHWEHPTKNTIFALAKLNLESFKDTVSRMNNLSEKFKEYVRKNAEKMHEELNKELEKR